MFQVDNAAVKHFRKQKLHMLKKDLKQSQRLFKQSQIKYQELQSRLKSKFYILI